MEMDTKRWNVIYKVMLEIEDDLQDRCDNHELVKETETHLIFMCYTIEIKNNEEIISQKWEETFNKEFLEWEEN
jgi:hypothetical protein